MKNYLNYLKTRPSKIAIMIAVIIFGGIINGVVNASEFNLLLSIAIGAFSTLIVGIFMLQVWGEYKEIEGFFPTLKAFFK
jgi:TRAP-type C4-dicarboxylate transport system permease large subunit